MASPRFKPGNHRGQHPFRRFRCVYCKLRTYVTFTELARHETVCEMRYLKKREWSTAIEIARRRERRETE